MSDYKSVTVSKGRGGWGGPLTVTPTDERPLVASITGGGIHPVAQKIADLTGGEVIDGFKSSAPFDKLAVAVIDCGGTARVGRLPDEEGPHRRRARHQPGRARWPSSSPSSSSCPASSPRT